MKIKIKKVALSQAINLPTAKRVKPKKPNILFRTILKVATLPDLWAVNFKMNKEGMEFLKEPALILMNHSSFLDLEIMVNKIYPKPMNIVTTVDGLVGQEWLLRNIGCMPTRKFVTDLNVIKDIKYCIDKLKSNVLMYPEASYSFDGKATTLPESLGKFIKHLGAPVVTVITYGSFHRQPLYNDLKKRKVKASATMKYLLTPEQIKEMSADEIYNAINKEFAFDQFKWQKDNGVIIAEKDRAYCLERVLYKCPNCNAENATKGEGVTLTCSNCGKAYELTELGEMKALTGETEFTHIPDWYAWERERVKNELEKGEYLFEDDVELYVVRDTKALYSVGSAHLKHDNEGFTLTKEGEVIFTLKPLQSYSLYSDYNWYEIDDIIAIGDNQTTYYCAPKNIKTVAKVRLAAEELYKIKKEEI